MHLNIEYHTFLTHLVLTGKGHKRTSLPKTSCMFLQHPKLNPFLSLPSENLGGRKDSKIKMNYILHLNNNLNMI